GRCGAGPWPAGWRLLAAGRSARRSDRRRSEMAHACHTAVAMGQAKCVVCVARKCANAFSVISDDARGTRVLSLQEVGDDVHLDVDRDCGVFVDWVFAPDRATPRTSALEHPPSTLQHP